MNHIELLLVCLPDSTVSIQRSGTVSFFFFFFSRHPQHLVQCLLQGNESKFNQAPLFLFYFMSPAEQSVILEYNGVIAAFLFLFSLPLVLPELWFMFSLYLCHSHLFFKASSVKITMIYQAHYMRQVYIILLNPQYNTYKVLFQFNR